MELQVIAGKTQFIIKNNSHRALEWEILDGVMVLAERENIAPGFMQKMTVKLEVGSYAMTCGLLTNPRGKLIVIADAAAPAYTVTANDLLGPIAEYSFFTIFEARSLRKIAAKITAAIAENDIALAKTLYAKARIHYKRIEPVASMFPDLSQRINAPASAFTAGETDPKFIGFHRLEYALWQQATTANLATIASQLQQDLTTLANLTKETALKTNPTISAAATVIAAMANNIANTIENRYAHTDLSEILASIAGVQKIASIYQPILIKLNVPLQQRIDNTIATIVAKINQHQLTQGYPALNTLSTSQRLTLQTLATELAQSLNQLASNLAT